MAAAVETVDAEISDLRQIAVLIDELKVCPHLPRRRPWRMTTAMRRNIEAHSGARGSA
jgi:hypothetical protein